MANKNQHVVPHPQGWAVKERVTRKLRLSTRPSGKRLAAAREIAHNQGSELLIHGVNGRIRERNTYGNDPYPPKG